MRAGMQAGASLLVTAAANFVDMHSERHHRAVAIVTSRAARSGAVVERAGMRRARETRHHTGLGPEPGHQLDVGVTATAGSRQIGCRRGTGGIGNLQDEMVLVAVDAHRRQLGAGRAGPAVSRMLVEYELIDGKVVGPHDGHVGVAAAAGLDDLGRLFEPAHSGMARHGSFSQGVAQVTVDAGHALSGMGATTPPNLGSRMAGGALARPGGLHGEKYSRQKQRRQQGTEEDAGSHLATTRPRVVSASHAKARTAASVSRRGRLIAA